MIKFFRKIRQKLLSENKFSKYLIYAIGEILLVVIGILIALQINNWNENRVNTKKEIFHLKNISNNLTYDLNEEIIPCIKKTEKQVKAYDLLKSDFYEKNIISNDSIRKLFFQNLSEWDLILNTVAFDNLKSIGMDIISNDTIKTQLLTLYGNKYPYIQRIESENNKFHSDGVTTLLQNNVELWDELSEQDKNFLRNDKRLINRLRSEKYGFQKYIYALGNIKPEIDNLIKEIENEIIRLKKK